MSLPSLLVRMRQFSPFMLMLASVALATLAYWQAISYSFNADDDWYVTNNAKLTDLHLHELWRLFVEPYNIYEFLPLRDLSYWIDINLFGMNPSAFRMHNLLLYLLCLPLVYSTTLNLWRYFRPADAASASWAASIIVALFTIHPAHVEAVVWISGRKDVLSAMFSLLALWFTVSARREQGLSVPHSIATMITLVAAMLSKVTAIAVAPVIAMLWIIFWRDIQVSSRPRSHLLWSFAVLLLAACTALVFTASSTIKAPVYFGVEVITRTLAVLGWLARLAVSPESRHFFYPVLDDKYLTIMLALGVAILAVSIVGMIITLRQRSLESFAAVTFLLLCVPYLQLIPYRAPSLVADRWLALAVWPTILVVVSLAWRFKPMFRTVLLLTIALPWCFQTIVRPHDWRSFVAVIDSDLRVYPWYYMPAMYKIMNDQLPDGLTHDARVTANNITDPVFRDFMIRQINAEYAVKTVPYATGNSKNAMDILWRWGKELEHPPVKTKWDPSIKLAWDVSQYRLARMWQILIGKFPDDVSVRYNGGLWLLSVNKYEEAATQFRGAIESQRLTENLRGEAFMNLGLALLGAGHAVEAEAPLLAALEQSPPSLIAHCLLSSVYQQSKRFEEAASAEARCSANKKIPQ